MRRNLASPINGAASPFSTESNEPEIPVGKSLKEEFDNDPFCLGCGEKFVIPLKRREGCIIASKENSMCCGPCVAQYSLQPLKGIAYIYFFTKLINIHSH